MSRKLDFLFRPRGRWVLQFVRLAVLVGFADGCGGGTAIVTGIRRRDASEDRGGSADGTLEGGSADVELDAAGPDGGGVDVGDGAAMDVAEVSGDLGEVALPFDAEEPAAADTTVPFDATGMDVAMDFGLEAMDAGSDSGTDAAPDAGGMDAATGDAAEAELRTPDSNATRDGVATDALTDGVDGDRAEDSGSEAEGMMAPCGATNQSCCAMDTCVPGNVCEAGFCRACGVRDRTCCPDRLGDRTLCNAGLLCVAAEGLCRCGAVGQACCEGGVCGPGTVCDRITCTACGGAGQPCCAGATCMSGLDCVGGVCGCGTPGRRCCGGTTCSAGLCFAGDCRGDCGAEAQPCCGGTTCAGGFTCSGGVCRNVCGMVGTPCCATITPCGVGALCRASVCIACGARDTACCEGATCGPSLACDLLRDRCLCGAVGQPCCGGTTCDVGVCESSGGATQCVACGASLEPCCPGSACAAGNLCVSGMCSPCGSARQRCCPGGTCGAGLECVGASCALCGGRDQRCCTMRDPCEVGLACSGGTCQP